MVEPLSRDNTPDLIAAGGERLSRLERAQIRFIRRTFESQPLDRAVRICQQLFGSRWITFCTGRLTQLHHLERLPDLTGDQSMLLVSNHRSFFDLYVITANLVKRGMKHRILFPVRSQFFYDSPLGFAVNGAMSFFAMYPPIFRERARAAVNLASLEEMAYRLTQRGVFVGIHPEGTRNLGEDPYNLLPSQTGVGRVVHRAKVPVIPVFINGLQNDIVRQIRSNFDGTGEPIHVVFGAPIDFGELLSAPSSPRASRAITDRCMEAIAKLGQEERQLRQGA